MFPAKYSVVMQNHKLNTDLLEFTGVGPNWRPKGTTDFDDGALYVDGETVECPLCPSAEFKEEFLLPNNPPNYVCRGCGINVFASNTRVKL